MNQTEMLYIGSGAQADVYRWGDKAVKWFKNAGDCAQARQEFVLQKSALAQGLPVPAVYEVTTLEGRPALIMEYVKGPTLGELLPQSPEAAQYYFTLSVDLQIQTHQIPAHGFPRQTDRLRENILAAPYLDARQRQRLCQLLEGFSPECVICHGDFHVLNLVKTASDIKILDWPCASGGSAASDACRTYLLYLLYRPDLAEMFLPLYCGRSGVSREHVLAWLPVVAGARLNEPVTPEHIEVLLRLVEGAQ